MLDRMGRLLDRDFGILVGRWGLGVVDFGSLGVGVEMAALRIQMGRVVVEHFGIVGSFAGFQCWMCMLYWLQGIS